ncbi:MAG: DUF1565 domain-containing protein [Verrucomicrobia subdivision 3 bacterium]|nr:DUF1565 domain-containing protein [Limisphaerales bacterium]
MKRLVAATALILALWHIAPAIARNYYVATNGSDEHSGSETEPLRTLQKAASVARAGDTVLVRAGVYKGHVQLRFSGAADKPIIFRNYPGERPVLDGEGRGRIELQSEKGWQKAIGWITVEGIEVRNGWDGIKFYNAHNIVLRGNYLHGNLNQGILGNGHDVRIEGNIIAENGFKADNQKSNKEHGIYCTGTDFTIVNNVIYSNKAYGIQVAGYPYKPENHAGPEFADARRWMISHNTIAFQQNRSGIVVWQKGATDCVIQNNIFFKNATALGQSDLQGIDFVAAGGGHVIRHNLFFAPGRTSIGKSSAGYLASENLEQDPLFVDAERFDFHLGKDSPAIDAGTNENSVAYDCEGAARPQGRGYDIGAYEQRSVKR